MTFGGWVLFIVLALCAFGLAAVVAIEVDTKTGMVVTFLVTLVLVLAMFGGFMFYYHGTESGQRAFKTQQSNFEGGLNRTVTVYSYSGDEIRSWTGKFDVTENDQETYFDIDGRRVIIQGGIIINEEGPEK